MGFFYGQAHKRKPIRLMNAHEKMRALLLVSNKRRKQKMMRNGHWSYSLRAWVDGLLRTYDLKRQRCNSHCCCTLPTGTVTVDIVHFSSPQNVKTLEMKIGEG